MTVFAVALAVLGVVTAAFAQTTIDVAAPGNALTTTQATATFPVTISRSSTTPVLGFSVTFSISGNLTLPSGAGSISAGSFLTASGATATLQVRDLGGGQYVADGVTLGMPCGSSATSGTLFTVTVSSAAAGGTGTLTIGSVTLRDCSNQPLAASVGTSGSVPVDNTVPVVTVTSPDGGESWDAGSSHDITWTATDPEGFGSAAIDIEWSSNGLAPWTAIATGIAHSGSFSWLVPDVATHAARVRITARDTYGNSATDSSNDPFTVRGSTTTSLVAVPDPSVLTGSATLTATVTPSSATGSVEFFDGPTSLGTAAVASGAAELVTSSLALGPHSLTAQYLGDASLAGSTSAAYPLEVKAKIVATAGANGSLSPLGTVLVSAGASQEFTFAADPGYHVSAVTVDGSPVALTSPYTFAAVAANHTIDVQFVVNPPVPAITTLSSTTLRTGNGTSGTMRIQLGWSPVAPGSSVQVWRAPYGNYPEYDDGPSAGSVPAIPSYPPPSPWTLTAVTTPGETDTPATRDFYYYVAFVTDSYGTRSPVSNRTAGSLAYALGDVSDGFVVGQGDNQVFVADLSLLGSVYGSTLTLGAAANVVDVGPTTDFSVHGRPTTDNIINFEDLVMFAVNYDQVSTPAASAHPAPATRDELRLESPADVVAGTSFVTRLRMSGTGAVHAVSARLAWDAAVVEPVEVTAGGFLAAQEGVVFSPAPGTVDLAVLGAGRPGVSGEGEVALVTFRALRSGAPALRLTSADARDASNRRVNLATGVNATRQAVFTTALAIPRPSPFRDRTQVVFTLGSPAAVQLTVHSVDGRLTRTLTDGPLEAGEHRLEWDGRDDRGRLAAAGVYYVRLQSPHAQYTRKLTFLR